MIGIAAFIVTVGMFFVDYRLKKLAQLQGEILRELKNIRYESSMAANPPPLPLQE